MESDLALAELNAQRRGRIIIGVIFGAFLAALDTTILATAMPTIVGELGGLGLYSWVFSVYMIMTAVSTPLWGKIADTIGKRPALFASIILFLIGSAFCGLSRSMTQLIVFRGVQGLGAGGLASVPFALISTVFPAHERGKALGFLSSTWGISSVIGPLIGSFVVVHFDWRWLFYVNIPGGIASIAIVAANFHERRAQRTGTIDYLGAALLCLAIVSLLLTSLVAGRAGQVFTKEVVAAFASFVVCTALFIVREGRVSNPILELQFFRRRAFFLGNLLGFLASFAIYGVIAYMPLFAHSVLAGATLEAGIVVACMTLSWSTTSIIAGRLVYRLGEKNLILAGMLLMSGGFVLALQATTQSPVYFLVLVVAVIGSGMGTQTPALVLSVQHSLDAKNIGVATSMQMLARTIGGAVGVSVMGSSITGSMRTQFSSYAENGLIDRFPEAAKIHLGQPQELLSAQMRSLLSEQDLALVVDSFSRAVHDAFLIGLFVTIAGFSISLLLPPPVLHTLHTETPSPDAGQE